MHSISIVENIDTTVMVVCPCLKSTSAELNACSTAECMYDGMMQQRHNVSHSILHPCSERPYWGDRRDSMFALLKQSHCHAITTNIVLQRSSECTDKQQCYRTLYQDMF